MTKRTIHMRYLEDGSRPNHQGNSSAAVASEVVSATACLLTFLLVTNTGASAVWVQVHDASASPADSAVPLISMLLPAGEEVSLAVPVSLATGCVVAGSTTAGTLTNGGTLLVFAQWFGA